MLMDRNFDILSIKSKLVEDVKELALWENNFDGYDSIKFSEEVINNSLKLIDLLLNENEKEELISVIKNIEIEPQSNGVLSFYIYYKDFKDFKDKEIKYLKNFNIIEENLFKLELTNIDIGKTKFSSYSKFKSKDGKQKSGLFIDGVFKTENINKLLNEIKAFKFLVF